MFGVVGQKEPLEHREFRYLSNTEKTLTSTNLSASLNLSGNIRLHKPVYSRSLSAMASHDVAHNEGVPTLEDLECTLSKLKSDLKNLNDSLEENYAKSRVYARDANYDDRKYKNEFERGNAIAINKYSGDTNEELDLVDLLQRKDEEAVSHLPPSDPKWYNDPQHLTSSMGNFQVSKSLGISTRSVSPTNRRVGIFGSEMATKNYDGQLNSSDLASNIDTFPVRLTAPHIVGVRSLLPPKIPVRKQKSTSDSPTRNLSSEVTIVPDFPMHSSAKVRNRSPSPKPTWMPNSRNANAISKTPPALKTAKYRRPATAPGKMRESSNSDLITRGRSITRHKTMSNGSYPRQIHPLPTETELRFLRSADQIDTRRALVENSPYQQELARLRLIRLRVEEEYLLQLKRESELERIRGPKPKWYTMKGPQFHYECNKNTALHKNRKSWAKTLRYRDDLLDSSREFAQTV